MHDCTSIMSRQNLMLSAMALSFLKLFLVLLTLQLPICICESRIYHITPLQNQVKNSSLTLSRFAANSIKLGQLHHNVTLILLSGNHSLQTEFLLSNITFFSLISNESSSVRIICRQNDSNLIFVGVANAHISGVEFFSM